MAQKEYLKMADAFKGSVFHYDNAKFLADEDGYCGEFNERDFTLYAANAINSHDELVAEVERLREMVADWPKKVDSVEDITEIGNEILVYDGCEWAIDFVDVDVDTGSHFMANYHEVEQWMPLPEAK